LDYLGRDDFYEIAGNLKVELLNYGFIKDENEWKRLQLNFLGFHHYHTASSTKLREPVKRAYFHQLSL
jgi:hypothetical protein